MPLPLFLAAMGVMGAYSHSQGKKQAEQARQAQQYAQQARRQGAVDLATGAGLPMGPRMDTTPAEQQQLGGIVRGMASPFEDVREQAFGQLE